MKHTTFFRVAAAALALLLTLSLAACSIQYEKPAGSFGKLDSPETQTSASDTASEPELDSSSTEASDLSSTETPDAEPHVYSEAAQASLEELYANGSEKMFAAAYLGYWEEGDDSELVEWLYNNYPLMPALWPFLEEIPAEDVIGEYGDLYCVVPLDESVAFTVKGVEWELLGNGTMAHYSDPLYYAEIGRPFLMYVNYGQWKDETDLTLETVESDGFVGTWFPSYSEETGRIEDYYWVEREVLDFALLYDIGYNVDTPMGDMEWLPPTDLGLGDTVWYSENGWALQFAYDENAESGSGGVALYEPLPDGDDVVLSRYCQGVWWMEGDSVYIDAYNDRGEMVGGLFPILISPSGEQLIMKQADDGTVPPFFEEGQTETVLIFSTLP